LANTKENKLEELFLTSLNQLHKDNGGKMVEFAAYEMPVQYSDMGVLKEHLHTRENAGLFDVSHMGQAILKVSDSDPADFLEKITPGNLKGLKDGEMRYTLLLNDHGGIIDDLIVTRWDKNTLFLVVNAGCKAKDFAYIEDKIGGDINIEILTTRALIALQGPKAETVLKVIFPEATDLNFMTSTKVDYKNEELFLSRCGYTGEDGFEISVPENLAEHFAKELLSSEAVRLIGLGARDSLRLESGLCLYGHDLNEDITPVEANLKWAISKRRREEKNFCGADIIMSQFKNGTKTTRVGIKPEGKAPLREGTELFSKTGEKIGIITSGGFAPSLEYPIAMAYIDKGFSKIGTKIKAILRGKERLCFVEKMPFVKQNYKRG